MATSVSVVCPVCKIASFEAYGKCRVCGNSLFGSRSATAWRVFTVGAILLPFILVAGGFSGVYLYLNHRLQASTAYRESFTIASNSPDVQEILGNEIRRGTGGVGHLQGFEGAEFAEWSAPLAGPGGSGHLFGVANQVRGTWDYARLVFHSDDGKKTVDLTPVRSVSLPQVAPRTVYLIPIGLAESLEWAPSYYRRKLDIEVRVLPQAELDVGLIDSSRRQLDSEKCIYGFLAAKYPELVRDPSAVLIAVTSTDLYIPSLGWRYAENLRREGRFGVISSARLHPLSLMEKLNPEWLISRLQKLLTKNIVMLYFGLPMSSDYTSLLSGGVLSGREIDRMGQDLVGQEGQWDPFIDAGAPSITIYDVPGKTLLWSHAWSEHALPDTRSQLFSSELDIGLLVQRKTDFLFPDDPALNFTRVYRNEDDRSRAFGIGGTHEFDIFLGGKMRVAVDLIFADGVRVQFVHKGPVLGEAGDVYEPLNPQRERFVRAVFVGNIWHVKTIDGWVYDFPYTPQALPQYVTVLTGFADATHQRYEMKRDAAGALLEIVSPAGGWLHFENDANHRIRRITGSNGRSVQYDYNDGGSLVRATSSDGFVDAYTYDEKGQMLTASHADGQPVLTHEYYLDGYIKAQTLGNGQSFRYGYNRQGPTILNSYITYPNRLESYVEYRSSGYRQWPPSAPPN